MTKEEITALRSKEFIKGMTDIEVLKTYYSRDDLVIKLNDDQRNLDETINYILRLQTKGMSSTKIVRLLTRGNNVRKISTATAWNRLRLVNEIFGSIVDSSTAVKFHAIEEMLLNTYRKAQMVNSLKEMNGALKTLLDLYKEMNKGEDIDFDKLEKGLYVVALDEDIRQKLGMMIDKGGVVNVDDFMSYVDKTAEEIEFTSAEIIHDEEE